MWWRPRLELRLFLHFVLPVRWAVLGPLEQRVLLLGREVPVVLQPSNVVTRGCGPHC